jgi:zeaxanthin glucosyltransferase
MISDEIPSNTIVVRAAPQIDLLKRAALCITHAGLNTALEALAQGVPMLAIPVGFDQPGVAARIALHGVGEFIEVGNLTTRRLSDLIAKIKENPKYRDKAGWFQKVLSETRGLEVAADIVERAFEDRFEDKFGSRMLAISSAEETSFLP